MDQLNWFNKEKRFEEIVEAISSRYEPTSQLKTVARAALVETWGALVGGKRALAELNAFVDKCGSVTEARKQLRTSPGTFARWKDTFTKISENPDRFSSARTKPRRKPKFKHGDCIESWRLIEPLGKGGNGEVWKARSPSADVDAAIKLLSRTDDESELRFQREIATMHALQDLEGVMKILGQGQAKIRNTEAYWFSMPICKPIRQLELSSIEDIVKLYRSLADTMAEVHERGYSHIDIKPENLFQKDGRFLIGDFGLVYHAELFPELTVKNDRLGPLYYIAPEMMNNPRKANGQKADVFSLAKTMWVLFTGQQHPIPGCLKASYSGTQISSYVSHPNLDPVERLLESCTETVPGKRPTMKSLVGHLAQWLEGVCP